MWFQETSVEKLDVREDGAIIVDLAEEGEIDDRSDKDDDKTGCGSHLEVKI